MQPSSIENAPTPAIRLDVFSLVPKEDPPNYDRNVLIPLREVQREEAAKLASLTRDCEAKGGHFNGDECIMPPPPPPPPKPALMTEPYSAPAPTQTGSHTDWMAAAGITASDYGYVDYIVDHESGWRYWATNSEGSGATGVCQALPGSKMAIAGADYLTNPITQLIWCNSYALSVYGGWENAYNHWLNFHSW